MLKKLTIVIIYSFLLAFNANAGSDGELALKKKQQELLKKVAVEKLAEGAKKKLVEDAKKSNISRVYVRTTQTGHWFQELGFNAANETELPDIERQKAQYDRNSNILIRLLG